MATSRFWKRYGSPSFFLTAALMTWLPPHVQASGTLDECGARAGARHHMRLPHRSPRTGRRACGTRDEPHRLGSEWPSSRGSCATSPSIASGSAELATVEILHGWIARLARPPQPRPCRNHCRQIAWPCPALRLRHRRPQVRPHWPGQARSSMQTGHRHTSGTGH